jgi:(E)-4-hydroxy-3-methyl-but-2-enyl pyrophosphate reductase
MTMKIIRAGKAGFCFGVERAVSMAQEAIATANGPVRSLGPIIHNPQVVRELEEKGLEVVSSLDDVERGTVIIRSHGAPASVYLAAEERGLTLLDATCPFVKKMHEKARRLAADGYQVVLFGEREHPEIASLLDDPGFEPIVTSSPEELAGTRHGKKVGLISQTTQSLDLFTAAAAAILPTVSELRVYNTICDSTRFRQEESLEIAGRVDLMIVIGGRNSANTHRLHDLCLTKTPAHLVEVPEELDPAWFTGIGSVGVTAGASTPRWLIDNVIDRIKSLNSGRG